MFQYVLKILTFMFKSRKPIIYLPTHLILNCIPVLLCFKSMELFMTTVINFYCLCLFIFTNILPTSLFVISSCILLFNFIFLLSKLFCSSFIETLSVITHSLWISKNILILPQSYSLLVRYRILGWKIFPFNIFKTLFHCLRHLLLLKRNSLIWL